MHQSTYLYLLAACLLLMFTQCSNDSTEQEKVATAAPVDQEKTTEKVVSAAIQPEVSKTDAKEITKIDAPKEEEAKVAPIAEKEPTKPKESVKSKKKTVPVKKKRARMKFSQTTHQFGTIQSGDKVKHKFTFKNSGDAPLVINNVDVSCGCTFPSYPFLPIEPGKTGEIEVTFDSEGKIGRQKPTITVMTNGRP
ncbi:MAG: DUF1573 domain-containing protein, partial [Bacteroidota bacterium]